MASPISTSSGGRAPAFFERVAGERPFVEDGPFLVRLARDADERLAAQRVRYEVFGLELDERLPGADELGLDVDRYDAACEHLLLIERATGQVVGTYRLQTRELAELGHGFYCDQEFELDALTPEVLDASVELGRACILESHRTGVGLLALWRGLVDFARARGKRYLFGCASLTGIDPEPAALADAWFARRGHRHEGLDVRARAPFTAPAADLDARALDEFRPPRLFAAYLRFGTRVCSGPALDREFGTTDFLVLWDFETAKPRLKRLLTDF